MSTIRKSYTEELKREAVDLMEKSGNKARTARDLGIPMSLLKKWQKKIHGNAANPYQSRTPREPRNLRLASGASLL